MDISDRSPRALEIEFPARAAELADVRHALRDWLAENTADPDRAYDLLLAASEACTNSVEHGHREDGRVITLRAEVDGRKVCITITDGGTWHPADEDADSHRGRGLMLIRALVPDTRVIVGDAGTVVELSAPLPS
ncbi:ATP-binding protein [Nocardia jiangsuensis]|uniref:ATP-binding protein n=1 Tax=Nocardia jiangsuensis TaxID=1691563 RepID=A0ABV8DZE9_9NOCA